MTSAFLGLGALCSPVFIAVMMLEGLARSRSGYNWRRHPISSLSIGACGWIQIVNFLVTGSLIVLVAIGLRLSLPPASWGSVWGPLMIGVSGIGLIGAGIFVSDPVFGYPPHLPLVVRQFTTRGHLHDLFSMFWFVGMPVAAFVLTARFVSASEPGWAAGSFLAALAVLGFFVLAAVGFSQKSGFVHLAGIFQRLSVSTGLVWLSILALHQI